jgi:hypothetical protein
VRRRQRPGAYRIRTLRDGRPVTTYNAVIYSLAFVAGGFLGAAVVFVGFTRHLRAASAKLYAARAGFERARARFDAAQSDDVRLRDPKPANGRR